MIGRAGAGRLTAAWMLTAGLLALPLAARAATPLQMQGSSTAIVMQGFHWNSSTYSSPNWYGRIQANAADMKDLGVTHVWFPPPSDAASAQGYLPRQLNLFSSAYGSQTDLQNAINALTGQGIKSIADIVINHRVGSTNWADFTNPTWSCTSVTNDDEWYSNGGSCGTRGANDTGNGYSSARDLDHNGSEVQNGVNSWLVNVKNLGFTGLRYDYAMGYRAGIQGTYTNNFAPDFCVDEIWTNLDLNNVDAHRQIEMNYISGDSANCSTSWNDPTCGTGNGQTCGTFDFTTHGLLVEVLTNNDYNKLMDSSGKPAGAIGWWPQFEVTFVDNHDTGPSESCGNGQNLWPVPCSAVMQGYAYILTHPGIPTLYWPHVYDWNLRASIKPLIQARQSMGVSSTSSIAIQSAVSGLYAAIITGTSGKIAMKIGPNSWSPTGTWTLAASGTNYAVWTQSGASAPAAPTGLTATAASASQINLSWTASSGATSYTVYRSTSSSGPFTTSVGTPTGTSFSDTGLTASTTYYYQVSASSSGGTSANSATASATTSAAGPTSPYAHMYLRGTMTATTWDTSQAMTLVANDTWQFTVNLAANTAYSYKYDASGTWATGQNWGAGGTAGVAVVNSSTNITYTSGVAGAYTFQFNDSTLAYSVTAPAPTVPAAPTGLTATAASSSQINLSWTASSGATSYTVYRSTSSSGPFTTSVGTSTTTSFSNTGLTASTTYYYQVSATNSAGTSANSATASATTQASSGFTSPYAHMYLRGTMTATTWDTSQSMTLVANNTWQFTVTLAANTAYSYKYDASGTWATGQNWGAGGTAGVAVVNSSTNISYTTGVAGSYTFQFNDSTLAYSVTGPPGNAPAAPTGLTATAASTSQINLSWTASSGATSYTVYRSTSSSGPFTTSVGTSTTTSFSNTGLAAGTTYYYQVSATNSYGTSANSATASATTSYAANWANMYLRGTMNAWGTTAMTLVGNNTWRVQVTLTASTAYQYKYDASGTWATGQNWGAGGTAGVAVVNSSTNIGYTTGTGTSYTFTFNDSTLAYSVSSP